jgi:uncharacterized surface protein with fasciclin (FAS1) repeats
MYCGLFYRQINKTRMSNIVEMVGADKNLVNMLRGVRASGLDEILSLKGPFTIFAPTDMAFGKLEAGRMKHLLQAENKEQLTELLSHHMVDGLVNFCDLQDDQKLVTRNGRVLLIKVENGKVRINGATVQGRDSTGSNGVVHSLDTVIEMKPLPVPSQDVKR